MNKIVEFLTEAKAELLRVNWPKRQEIVRYTMLVIIISLVVAIFLGSLDYLFSYLVENFLLTR
ncbi:MAG: preprotein translocase subunit SecE [Candidatus Moranbacteria bacterium RIFCSPHIGHO2_01_FULL_55_24]|nr:MAG: preprotein translocase subunit SecE [Candidatus Moranbacteria bacterium RIFCSPHIGHO2_01_FULL_55_24]